MGFQQFLDDNSVKNIDPKFAQVMDEVGEPIVRLAFGIPPGPGLSSAALISVVPLALAAKSGVADPAAAAGAALFMTAISADIDALLVAILTAGSLGLAKVPPLGVPGGPIFPSALALGPSALNPAFGIAVLQWAVSLLPPGDLRIIVPFIA